MRTDIMNSTPPASDPARSPRANGRDTIRHRDDVLSLPFRLHLIAPFVARRATPSTPVIHEDRVRPGARARIGTRMDTIAFSLRVTAPDPDVARVSIGRRQFSIGRPLEFDDASPHVAAIEYALGAVGGEIVNGLRAFADRRRLSIDAVEAVVSGALESGLTYLEVIGEQGQPRIARIHVKVFVSCAGRRRHSRPVRARCSIGSRSSAPSGRRSS